MVGTELRGLGSGAYFARMRSGWLRWAAFMAAIGALVGFVTVATWNEPQSTELLVTEAAFIGVVAYLVTHLIWPRHHRGATSTHPSLSSAPSPVPAEPGTADHDPRPCLLPPDWSGGYKSIYAYQQDER